ncbi:MAG: hypothetical protein WA191_07020 [Telluria sp.]
MSAALTDWFDGSVKPEYVGLYQRDYGDEYEAASATLLPDFWDGSKWIVLDYDGNHIGNAAVELPWRGLASDPKASKP